MGDATKDQERLLNLIFEHTLDNIVLLDKDYNFIKVSDTYAGATQKEAVEFIGKNHFELYPSNFEQEIEEYRAQKKIYKRNQRPFVFPDHPEWGTTYWDIGLVPILDDSNEIEFFLFTLKNVTERVRAEEALVESQSRLALATKAGNVGVWDWDLTRDILIWDDSMFNLYGVKKEDFSGAYEAWRACLHEEDLAYAEKEVQLSIANKKPLKIEFRIVGPSGEVRHIRSNGDVIQDEDGEAARMIGTNIDITEQVKADELMQMATSIYKSSTEAIMVTDKDNRIIQVNPAFTEITGYSLEEVRGKDPKVLKSGRHSKLFYKDMWDSLLSTGSWRGEIFDRRKDGSVYAKWSNISVIRDADGKPFRFIALFSDITEKKKKDEIIWKQANYDTLTNLPNRRLFFDRLSQEMKVAQRSGKSLALLFIDLDRFKEINDTIGHAKGDLLLIEAASRISSCVRETDTVSRLGGDEFTAIITEVSENSNIEKVAQNIIHTLSEPFYFKGDNNGYYISASIGITVFPGDAKTLEGLLKNADQAMYQAKEQGRHRYNYFTQSMQKEALRKFELNHGLREALLKNRLKVFYQPIINISTGEIAKAEALIRWNDPKRGSISPAEFIPIAEETGLIHEIGDWVYNTVIQDIKKWRDNLGKIVGVSVNKSPAQFQYKTDDSTWLGLLKEYDLPGNAVTIEITEGLLLKQSNKVHKQLNEYKKNGIEVSIDDFGTGFSALSYLKKFDIDYLKIDRSFIQNIIEDDSDKALTEAIIVMAHKLGIRTIAEGVETKEQLDLLALFNCDFAQGFYFSPAISFDDFSKRIDHI